MEQLVNYFNFGQGTVRFPDREAKLSRNRPSVAQLDYDAQEDQERKWEEEKRYRKAQKGRRGV